MHPRFLHVLSALLVTAIFKNFYEVYSTILPHFQDFCGLYRTIFLVWGIYLLRMVHGMIRFAEYPKINEDVIDKIGWGCNWIFFFTQMAIFLLAYYSLETLSSKGFSDWTSIAFIFFFAYILWDGLSWYIYKRYKILDVKIYNIPLKKLLYKWFGGNLYSMIFITILWCLTLNEFKPPVGYKEQLIYYILILAWGGRVIIADYIWLNQFYFPGKIRVVKIHKNLKNV